METKDLNEMSKEELIELCEKQKKDIDFAHNLKEFYVIENKKLKSKLEIISQTLNL